MSLQNPSITHSTHMRISGSYDGGALIDGPPQTSASASAAQRRPCRSTEDENRQCSKEERERGRDHPERIYGVLYS
jgi:hypothetical protein